MFASVTAEALKAVFSEMKVKEEEEKRGGEGEEEEVLILFIYLLGQKCWLFSEYCYFVVKFDWFFTCFPYLST